MAPTTTYHELGGSHWQKYRLFASGAGGGNKGCGRATGFWRPRANPSPLPVPRGSGSSALAPPHKSSTFTALFLFLHLPSLFNFVCGHAHISAGVWRSEDNFREIFFTAGCLHLVRHLTSPLFSFL